MAKVLCVWEMGQGLGHLTNLRPFVDAARAAGHAPSLAATALDTAGLVFPDADLPVFQAPYLWRVPRQADGPLLSYAHLVLQRFETEEELAALCRSWDAIFEAVRPDLVVYDFAPSALIASLYRPWRKWVIGSGFLVPRCDGPFFGLFPGVRDEPGNVERLARGEERLRMLVNAVLARQGRPPITQAGALLRQADETLLLTLPELDHFGVRPGVRYLGLPPPLAGAPPAWPAGGSLRVFAYLSAFPALEPLLDELSRLDASVLVYSREIGSALRERHPRIGFADRPLDLPSVYAQADLAVNMANHTTSAQAFLAGVPQLMIPRRQEQGFLARRVLACGRGVILRPDGQQLPERVAAAVALARAGRTPLQPGRQRALQGPTLAARLPALFRDLPPTLLA
jgi:UDP:flavonoid glycosyltransferase YjiC (YdhE family)